MTVLGIDIGTTTISTVALDTADGRVVRSGTVLNQSFIDTGNEWERVQDVSLIMETALASLDEMLDECPDAAAIGLTGQMHGILYYNRDGECVSPLYTWQDGRGNLGERSVAEEISDTCGIAAASGYGLVTHICNLRAGNVPEEASGLCTIADYLGMKLTGRRRALMHASNAAGIGFFDVESGRFLRDELREMGAESVIPMLPEVCGMFEVTGSWRGIPVTVAIGDNQASFLGSAGMSEDTVLVNMGTGGQISVLSDRCFTAPGIEARPFAGGKYLLAGSSLCGGRAYAILERFFRSFAQAAGAGGESLYGLMQELAEEGERMEDPVRVVTAFRGTRADPGLRGSVTGITEDNFTPASLTYGILKGMAEELFGMYRTIREGTGVRAGRLIASGNGLRLNPVLRRIFSEMFGAELELAPYEEEAACGAALSSKTGAGL